MKRLKNLVKTDFENKLDKKLSFDLNKLEDNPKKRSFKWLAVVACLAPCFIFLVYFASQVLETKDSFSQKNKKYSLNEIKLIEQSTFRKINPDNFPSSSLSNHKNSEEYVNAIQNFTNKIYHNATNKKDNFSFSPMGLYSNLNILSYAASSASDELDSLLGLTQNEREVEFKKMVDNNYFSNSDGVVQLSNAAFFTNQFAYNDEYVNRLTSNYVEAYQLDFLKDKEYLFDWIDQKLHESEFIDDKELSIDDETSLYILSTLYFDNRWQHRFPTSKTKVDNFYLASGETINVPFMETTYMGYIYDHGEFISLLNYYHNGYHIEYFVPKKLEDNIYELTKDYDLFKVIDKENAFYGTIEISVPKFSSSYSYNFNETLENVGLTNSFNPYAKPFNNAFKNLDKDTSIYLYEVKQKNKISFNESGTIIKSLTFSMAKNDAMLNNGEYQIKLNQPYIYIIYDRNNIPLYLGNVDNPNK